MAGGFGLKYGGFRTLVPEDADGRVNEQQLRNAMNTFYQNVRSRGLGMAPAPWQGGGIDGMRKAREWQNMVDYKVRAVGKKNELIDRAERGDEDAIKELNHMMAKEKNLGLLRQQYKLPKRAKMIQGISKGRR